MDRAAAVTFLGSIPDEEMLDLLRQVFARRTPNPEEAAYCRTRYFLGTASSMLDDESDPEADPSVQQWGAWEIEAVAYPDPDHYGSAFGPDWGFCEGGTCLTCTTKVRSNVKYGLCPICGAKVFMT